MPPEPLPFDRKDFFKERKPSSSDSLGPVQARWREPPTTPPPHNNHGSTSSYRCGSSGGSSDIRRPFSGHGKQDADGWHMNTEESGSQGADGKYYRNNIREGDNNNDTVSVSFSSQDWKGHSWETTVSPNGNFHPHSDFVNLWDQLQSKDQHDKDNAGGVAIIAGQKLEKNNLLGSSVGWKPLKWVRSGSLSSRGSGFSHSSSSKSIGVDSLDTKIEAQPGTTTPLQSPSGDAAPCVTSREPAEETSSRKKQRLGWGEGLAKYEKKKVDGPDEIVDKEAGARNGAVNSVINLESLHPSSAHLADKSPSLTNYSECASPATPSSVACSSSPGVETKAVIKAATVDNEPCHPCVSSGHLSENHKDGTTFNLENLDSQVVDLSSSLNELLQSNDNGAVGSGFVRSNAMDKLKVWKSDISKTLEVTESEIDSLENELKSLISDIGDSRARPAASSSLPAVCNDKNSEKRSRPSHLKISSLGDMPMAKDAAVEKQTEVKDMDVDSPGTATSNFVELLPLSKNVSDSNAARQSDYPVDSDIRSEKIEAKGSVDDGSDEILGVVTKCGTGSQIPAGSSLSMIGTVHSVREDKLCDLIVASNRDLANRASEEFNKLLPTKEWCTDTSRTTSASTVKEKFAMRKRFLKFKERVITLKYRVFQHLWKEDLRLLSIRRFTAKSQKKLELSSRTVYNGYQKHRSVRSRFSSPAGNLSLVPTREIINYTNKLLADSQVRTYRDTLKMPALILDKRERMTSRFVSNNGLVEDPCADEKEKYSVNPWMPEEKEIFLEKFALFGKDFKKIASFLDHKTVADCVEFYYKNHKSERFQKTKKNPEFAKQGKSYPTNTYLVTSGKRWNRETNAASLDMLGAASAIAANKSKFYVGTSSENKSPRADGGMFGRSSSLVVFGNERETAAADVLAGICGSISSEALSSCITSSIDPGDVYQERRCKTVGGFSKRPPLTPDVFQHDVDEDTCSDESCGEMDSVDWTDEEKSNFIRAVAAYGKDFSVVSQQMRTRSRDQCKIFFSKAKKCLGLDKVYPQPCSQGKNDPNEGGESDHEDACMVDSVSVISHSKLSTDCRMELEDLQLSFSKAENAECDLNVVTECRVPEHGSENFVSDGFEATNNSENINLEEAASEGEITESAKLEATPNNTNSEQGVSLEAASVGEMIDQRSSSGVEVEADAVDKVSSASTGRIMKPEWMDVVSEDVVTSPRSSGGSSLDLSIDPGNVIGLSAAEKPCVVSREQDNCFLNSRDSIVISHRKTLSQDDTSSRLSFRKSSDRLSQRSSSTDGYLLHLPKHSLLDCVESSHIHTNNGMNMSYNESQNTSKLGRSLLPTRDFTLQKCNNLNHTKDLSSDASFSQEQGPSSSTTAEKPNRVGNVKLFGQILTSQQEQRPKSNCNTEVAPSDEKQNGGKFFNYGTDVERRSSNYFGFENNPPLRTYGFWDGNRIQTGFQSLPDSAILLAKYPAAFGNGSPSPKLDLTVKSSKEQRNLNIVSGFHTREPSSNNRGSYSLPPFTVDKLLFSEMQRNSEALCNKQQQQQQQGRGMVGINVMGSGGACNGVSDPVAAIKMHYAKTEQYKNGSGGGDIGR